MDVAQSQFEAFLADISDCFTQKDFEMWRSRIILPFTLVTREGPIVLDNDTALRRNYDLYLSACDIMRLDTVVRVPLDLEDCGDGTWHGTYETRLISRSAMASAPYIATARLHDVDGKLKMSSILNARGHSDWTGEHDK